MKTILFWTTWFKTKLEIDFKSCPVQNCRIIHDRYKLKESDAVVFHFHTSDRLKGLPTCRRPDQRYIFFNFESPINVAAKTLKIYDKLPSNYFNWTATYRLDSDLFSNKFYGFEFKQTNPYGNRPNFSDYYGINITTKNKTAAWFVSNCKTSVNREGYIEELKKHIQVDVFGSKCLEHSKSCPRKEQNKCDTMLKNEYFFYLSFENSFCPDYVTEKFYRAFETGTVPVVFGGANYSLFAPPHSYINARDFRTPQLLAEYLFRLTQNLDLYSRYLDWRGEMNMYRPSTEPWCNLCKMMNDPNQETKSYADIKKWWFDEHPCENYSFKKT